MDTPRALVPVSAVALAVLLAGCAAGGMPDSTPSASPPSSSPAESSPVPTEAPSGEAFAFPDTTDPAQVAISLKYGDTDPSGEIIAGPAVLVADRPFSVEAQCEGVGVSFEVVTADAEQRVLAAGDVVCDDPPAGEFTYQLPYAGPVQVNLVDADDAARAWVRVVQP